LIISDQYLRPMLEAGSSRVFNCNDRSRKLIRDGVKEPYFFKLPKMHGLVLVKQAILQGARPEEGAQVVGTKLYFPYNQDDVYEGGRSVFFHDPRLLEILNQLFGLQGATFAEADLMHDMKVLEILDRLPSLDGFLMRDALELEGIDANEKYFEVSDTEKTAIREYIRRKFEPLVRAACEDDPSLLGRVANLIDKIWEAKDRVALDPLIRAFRFPDDEALAIFASWKGINFYTFEYYRAKQKRDQFGIWLRDKSMPRDFVSKHDNNYIAQLRRSAIERLREHWNAVEGVAREYESLYDRFLSGPDGVGNFVGFLRRSREIYWRMGDSLSKINHAVHCWDATSSAFYERRLPADKLIYLFDILQAVLSGSEPAESAAMVWS
jgi:hypothetical protein